MANSQLASQRYGRIYRKARQYASRREVLVSAYLILSLFTISFFAAVFIRPTAVTIAKLWREIQDKKVVYSQLEKKINDLKKAQSLYTSIEDDLVYLNRALPSDSEFSKLVREIEYLASSHGLQFSSASYGELEVYSAYETTPSAAELVTYPFILSFRGSFSQLGSFLADFEWFDRILTIEYVSVLPELDKREGIYTLVISLRSSVYSFSEGPS